MSKEICHRDQRKLDQILEQVKTLSDVVDELRRELNDLKKVSHGVNRKDALFESTKAFKSDSSSVAGCEETRDQEPLSCKSSAINPSAIYGGLKSFRDRIIKIVQRVLASRRSPKRTQDKCVKSDQRRQVCLSPKEETEKLRKFAGRNKNDISKYVTDTSEGPGNSTDTSFTSDVSAQVEIATCSWQEDDKNFNYSPCRNATENSVHANPLSMSDDRAVVRTDRTTGELSKSEKQIFSKNRLKKYKKCSCGIQCPYALYKLPCSRNKCGKERKADDGIGGLALECLSFGGENNFLNFVNVDREREESGESCTVAHVGVDESPTSSLSVDLEVNVCNDYDNPEDIDKFSRRRRARTYIVNNMNARRNYDLTDPSGTKNGPSSNVNSSWKNRGEKKKKIDEIIENILSQRRYINPPEGNQPGRRTRIEDFVDNCWPTKSSNKQIQCAIPACITPISSRKMSIKTSTPDFQHSEFKTSFLKVTTPKRMKTNVNTQTARLSRFSCLGSINLSVVLDDCRNARDTKRTEENENKKIKRSACDVSSSQIISPRAKRYFPALRTEEDDEFVYSDEPLGSALDQTCGSDYERNEVTADRTFRPYYRKHASAGKRENLATLMSYLTDYRPFPKALDFDMSNVSGRLHGCLEKLEDITA